MADQFLTTKSVLGLAERVRLAPHVLEYIGAGPTDATSATDMLNGGWTMSGKSDHLLNHLNKIGDIGLFFVRVSVWGPFGTYPFGILVWSNPCILVQLSDAGIYYARFGGLYYNNAWKVRHFFSKLDN